ncbi:MAG: malto-oligosyltrehalose synthase, partial [Candidatus Bathyarchaeota archaeon]
NRLISLNEVGADPQIFGRSIGDFHEFNKTRLNKWPFSMNTTSTHDTKRGEDVRARLNVLSEMPSEWGAKVRKWAELNFNKKIRVGNKLAPDNNEEYYIYQTLVGAFPSKLDELPEFAERVKEHMVKAVREAKINSSWLEPDVMYEKAITSFVGKTLDPAKGNRFLQDFIIFQKKIAYYGLFNSLSQILLKIASPGIPDFYQGTELWDLNLVDPDNRRNVDFEKRLRSLNDVLAISGKKLEMEKLLQNFEDGLVKLYETRRLLGVRRSSRKLFEEGDYIPIRVKGKYRKKIIAFCRKRNEEWAIIVAPRFLTSLIKLGEYPLGVKVWKNTQLLLPKNSPALWEEIFTQRNLHSTKMEHEDIFSVGCVLENFPVALLLNK